VGNLPQESSSFIPRRPELPPTLIVTLAILFAVTSTLYAAVWMYNTRYPGKQVELGFNHQHDELYNKHSIAVRDVVPDSPAERAGLRVGDHIIGVNGKLLRNSAPYDEAYARGRPGDKVDLTISRPGEEAPLILHGVFRAAASAKQEGLAKASAQQITGSYPVLFLLVGFAVLFLRLDDPDAWLLALLFSTFVATPGLINSASLPPALRIFADSFHLLVGGMLCSVFYIFFALFPSRSPLDRRFPWLRWASLVFGATMTVPGLWVGDMRSPGVAEHIVGERAGELTRQFYILGDYILIALGLISLLGNATAAAAGREGRRKSRVILLGTVFGVLPIVLERAAVNFAGYRPSFWADSAFIVVLMLYPLSFAYAVVKHRVMEIPVLLKRSARYVLVQRGFLVLLFVVAATAIVVFTHTFARFFPADSNLGMGLSAVFGIVLVWSSAPLVKKGTERIDRAFFRSAYDARVILEDLAGKTRAVNGRRELAELLEGHLREALHPKRLACYFKEGASGLVGICGALPGLETIPAEAPLLLELAQRRKSWDVPPAGSEEFERFALLAPLEPECLVPILDRRDDLTGLLVLGPRLSEESYSGEDKHLLDAVATQAGIALDNISLAEKMAERMEVERRAAMEMDIARSVQARLFPQKLPPLETLEYVGGCVQARQVGGDYYDFLDMGPGVVGIVLADISGKGMSGALLMANLQANLRSQYAVALDDLPRLLQSVNRLFYENTTEESYATMFFGVYDDSCRKLRYANCGHIAPLILRADGSIQRLTSTTTVLGLFLKWECPIEEEKLHPGDLLVICTDVVTEAPNAHGEEYGEMRLAEVMRENRCLAVSALLAVIQTSVQEFSGHTQADDITLILARCR
jgi:sigma-B regulation protein RsbU (phosphoserine phosphatase)